MDNLPRVPTEELLEATEAILPELGLDWIGENFFGIDPLQFSAFIVAFAEVIQDGAGNGCQCEVCERIRNIVAAMPTPNGGDNDSD
jgi:hypothetical protein